MGEQLPVAVDAMGGDNGPEVIVAGALQAVEQFNVGSLLVGDPDIIRQFGGDVEGIAIKPASEVIAMGADPASSVRALKDSSIVQAVRAVREGEACAVLSAGNTGAAMAASLLRLGRIKGVSRPAIAVPFPVFGSTPTTLLDCGANADCQPEWLVQFAELGTAYARHRFGIKEPRVGLLTIGEEAGKGNSFVKEASELLSDGGWAGSVGANYVGNIEGSELLAGVVDVLVCDGFTGNVVLKTLEGSFAIAEAAMRSALRSTPEVAATADVVDPVMDPLWHQLNSGNTGAAMLLGTRGLTMISHGSASAENVANAIVTASELAADDILSMLRQAVGSKK